MSKSDEYRQNAQECERMAKGAGDAAEKSSWLRLAESWKRMVRKNAKPEDGEDSTPDAEQKIGAQQNSKSRGKTDSSLPN